MDQYFEKGGPLSFFLRGFEPRDGQREMANAVASALQYCQEEEGHSDSCAVLVAEAETGIGKSLAYLIPAVLSGQRVIISTATLNLQDQLIDKDIPLVAKVIGQDVPAICLKGRQNYLCLYRWFQYCSTPQLSLVEDPSVKRIENWLKKTTTGDRAELDWLSDSSVLWSKISSQSNLCLGSDCPENGGCFITQLRKQAGSCTIIIVNHHLFFSDLALKKAGYGELLPRYEAVIFDEAHHVENVASSFFGKSFSQYQIIDLLSDVERQARADLPPTNVDELLAALSGLRQRVETFTQIFTGKTGRYYLNTLIDDISEEVWQEEVDLLSVGLSRLVCRIEEYEKLGEGWTSLSKRGTELNGTLLEIALRTDSEGKNFVHWYEKRERSISISATPIEVASELKENLYSSVRTCVMTSATLSSGGNFKYIQDRLGLGENTVYHQFGSPFDYAGRTLIYIPESGFPEPTSVDYFPRVSERALDILRLSEGRALMLFTSFRGMNSMADFLVGKLEYPILVQGEASRNSLLQKFREETDSVLLAVASFWEGVDVVGDSLSCVIIDKLPFEVPSDPVIQARIKRIQDEGGKPFFSFQVPRAILTLRQGVGRLMRSANDRGIIAIMDVRLFGKGYGRTFLKSMPPSPVTRNVKEIETFFR